jgi:glutathione synthase/RimK-type ligase-like ATP-grasp enzyme
VVIHDWHPTLQELAQRVMRAIPGLEFAGIDLLCENPRADIWQQAYCVIEINDSPGLSLAQLPAVNEGVDVAKSFVEVMLGE